jgi:lysophospholipase L1-like esterase
MMTKRLFCLVFSLLMVSALTTEAKHHADELKLFKADDSHIQYTGRIDFDNPAAPRIWAPGVYIKAKFKGSICQFLINDELQGGHNHNYLEIVVDNQAPYRIQLKEKNNVINLPAGLSNGEHTVLICKDTESNIGYIDFLGFKCEQLLPLPAKPKRKIEYFGDSITTGAGMDLSAIACNAGQWYDQHNAYMSYGASTSRSLDAQWQLTSLAGVGLIHSCCNMKVLMPMIYDKTFLIADSLTWDFKNYRPDVVTICLGQNDGVQDSTTYCTAYVNFIKAIRQHYPQADIVCLSSPMADAYLTAALKRYLTGITAFMNKTGDKRVTKFFFSRSYNKGCGGHPDLDEHKVIAAELTAYIKQLKSW